MNLQELESYSVFNYGYNVRDQFARHVNARSIAAFRAGDVARDAIATREQLRQRQTLIRETFLHGIGGLPDDAPLEPKITGRVEHQGLTIEKVMFQSRAGHYVTANLYLPPKLNGPTGAVLFVCGHHLLAKHEPEYQVVCQALAHNGLVVLAQDPVGQGERLDYYDPAVGETTNQWGTFEHDFAGSQCLLLDHGLARYFLHDAMRGIDYLSTRPEVDPKRIGVTGNSGGGTQTSMLMMAEPRIAAAAPGTFIMNRETYLWTGGAQDAEQVWPGFTAAGLDHEDIVLAMAPRPVRVLAVTWDFFPIEGTRRTVERCQRLFELAGAGDHLDLVEDDSVHRYTPKLVDAAAEFFCRHLLGTSRRFSAVEATTLEPKRLWVTQSGQVKGEVPDARGVHDACVEAVGRLPATYDRAAGLAWLRERVFAQRARCELNPRQVMAGVMQNLRVEVMWWWSQPDLINHGLIFRPVAEPDRAWPVTLAMWDGGTNVLAPHLEWIRAQVRGGRAVLLFEATGTGSIHPHRQNARPIEQFYGIEHKLGDDLDFLGDQLTAVRTYDVTRCLDFIDAWPTLDGGDVTAYGRGGPTVWLRLAAAIDARIKSVDAAGGIASYRQFVTERYYDPTAIRGQLLRGALRHFDLPDLDRWRDQRGR
jgi:hypothetical protein